MNATGELRFVSPEMDPVTAPGSRLGGARQQRGRAATWATGHDDRRAVRKQIMPQNSHYQLSTVDRPLAMCARPDIQLTTASLAGQAAYVLKDPITLELFHLTAEEFFLFQAPASQDDARSAAAGISAAVRATTDYARSDSGRFESIAQPRAARERSAGARPRADRAGRQATSPGVAAEFAAGVVDSRGEPRCRPRCSIGFTARCVGLFSLPMLAAAVMLVFYAGWILLGHASEVVARLPALAELAQPRYWLLWLATIAAVKVVHELAHALTCKHLGGRCHEMGVMLLALMPCLYCDVSDAWRMASKWRRIAVSAAGMAVELVIAAAALAAWWHTQPGLLNTWCLSTVIVCSVGTLLINANPLIRYDGYYILSDLVEVPTWPAAPRGCSPASFAAGCWGNHPRRIRCWARGDNGAVAVCRGGQGVSYGVGADDLRRSAGAGAALSFGEPRLLARCDNVAGDDGCSRGWRVATVEQSHQPPAASPAEDGIAAGCDRFGGGGGALLAHPIAR